MIDKRNHTDGNVFCENIVGINIFFPTNDKEIWEYVNKFTEFNHYINSPIAFAKGKFYNLPFNMNTFYQLWGTKTPEEAKEIIEKQTMQKIYICKSKITKKILKW